MSVILLPSVVLDSHSVYFSGSLPPLHDPPPPVSLSVCLSPSISSLLTYHRIPSSQPSMLHLLSPHFTHHAPGSAFGVYRRWQMGNLGNLQLLEKALPSMISCDLVVVAVSRQRKRAKCEGVGGCLAENRPDRNQNTTGIYGAAQKRFRLVLYR